MLNATHLPMRSSKKRSVASRASFSPSRTRTAAARRLPGVRLPLRGGRRVQAGAACRLRGEAQGQVAAIQFVAACNEGWHLAGLGGIEQNEVLHGAHPLSSARSSSMDVGYPASAALQPSISCCGGGVESAQNGGAVSAWDCRVGGSKCGSHCALNALDESRSSDAQCASHSTTTIPHLVAGALVVLADRQLHVLPHLVAEDGLKQEAVGACARE